MAKIKGQFDVTLPVPIAIDPKIISITLSPCVFQMNGSDVQILPLDYTKAEYNEELNDWEPPELKELRVWITKLDFVQKKKGNVS